VRQRTSYSLFTLPTTGQNLLAHRVPNRKKIPMNVNQTAPADDEDDAPTGDLDVPIWGVVAIAKAAGLSGKRAKIYRMLEAAPVIRQG
jgi:hypothetical protein